MKKYGWIVLLLLPSLLNGQTITTVGGAGSGGYLGNNDTPALAAHIYDPAGGAFDKYGNYYFADGEGSNSIRKIDNAGIISDVAGIGGSGGYSGDSGLAIDARLNFPQAVRVDSFGNLYIADVDNYRIRKVDNTTGIITTIAGTGTEGYSGDGGLSDTAKISVCVDICLDKKGNLYIADAGNYRIRKINDSGIISTFAGNGSPGASGYGGPASGANLPAPTGLAIDDTGNIYIADEINSQVYKVDTLGIITIVAGNGIGTYSVDGIPAVDASINPYKVAIGLSGQLFIADRANERIYEVDSTGIIHNVAGNGIAGFAGDGGLADTAEFNYPSGVAVNPCGNLYIPDVNNVRIRKVTFDSTCSLTNLVVKKVAAVATEVTIYPNPATDVLHIDNIKAATTYCILNMIGAVMQQGMLQEGGNSIGIQALTPGMYLLELKDDVGQKTVKKVMKE